MSKIKTYDNISINTVAEKLQTELLSCKFDFKGKNKLFIFDKTAMVLVKLKNNKLKISSDLNIKNKKIIVPLILGIVLGFFPVIIVIIVLYIVHNGRRKKLRNKIRKIAESEFAYK